VTCSPLSLRSEVESVLDLVFRAILLFGPCGAILPSRSLMIPEEDDLVNAAGVKGVGEIGTVGMPAAISNAVYHATGRRLRDLSASQGRWQATFLTPHDASQCHQTPLCSSAAPASLVVGLSTATGAPNVQFNLATGVCSTRRPRRPDLDRDRHRTRRQGSRAPTAAHPSRRSPP
jgi:hypothetical protein